MTTSISRTSGDFSPSGEKSPPDLRTDVRADIDEARHRIDAASEGAGDAVRSGFDTVREKTREGVETARKEAVGAAERAKNDAAERTSTVAHAINSMAEDLEGHGQPQAAGLARNAADHIDRFADDIRGRPVGDLFGDVEDFARRNPALVIGGAALAGFALARFLKSSADRNDGPEPMTSNEVYSRSVAASEPVRSYDPYRSTRR